MLKITFQIIPKNVPWPLNLLNLWTMAENILLGKCYR